MTPAQIAELERLDGPKMLGAIVGILGHYEAIPGVTTSALAMVNELVDYVEITARALPALLAEREARERDIQALHEDLERLARLSHEQLAEREALEKIAQFLFARLDDIDTLEDATKGDSRAFQVHAHRIHLRRFEVAETDGYTVTWKRAALANAGEVGR